MSGKNKRNDGLVYSTDPDYVVNHFEEETAETLPPSSQNLIVRRSTQGRAGKTATLVQRFKGSANDLEELSKALKKVCGTGGSVKDGEIIIQGDNIKKIVDYLLSKGYRAKAG